MAALVLMGGCTAVVGGAGGTTGGKAAPAPTVTVERTVPARVVEAVPTSTVTVTAEPQPAPTVTVSLPRATVTVTAPLVRKTTTRPETTEPTTEPESAYYANCSEARAAGVAPLYTGEPGYSRKLDRDGDGVACE
ncbi:excalibur calcium-binding domain-containing protein [Kribbella sp. NBC_01245]|uniref:excalibur calcium-binding domain-containing protein n=1 Tax=Kribbella sp. NBC_01245 TaxID=2903578 RepID=UPI002E2B691C|nr:excalibur calcium-binding domain-containing protein [Kribbella sp. NBC_01245]